MYSFFLLCLHIKNINRTRENDMKKSYLCPSCNSHLMLRDDIILTVFKSDSQKGLVLLSSEIGNYDYIYDKESIKLSLGDKVDVHCPVCTFNLGVDHEYKNLAKILMVDENGNKSFIYFSRIMGEQATFKVEGKKVDKFGQDSANYNYWGYSL